MISFNFQQIQTKIRKDVAKFYSFGKKQWTFVNFESVFLVFYMKNLWKVVFFGHLKIFNRKFIILYSHGKQHHFSFTLFGFGGTAAVGYSPLLIMRVPLIIDNAQ